MEFSEKLKLYRKENNLTQETFAEKLNVSRQAISKWESEGGLPDIENLKEISKLLNVTIDYLLNNDRKSSGEKMEYEYESITEYDIDNFKNFDISLNLAHDVVIESNDNEKLKILLQSNCIKNLDQEVKIKLDDLKNKIDVDVNKSENISKTELMENLVIKIKMPKNLIKKIELKIKSEKLTIKNIKTENIEIDGKTKNIVFDNVGEHIELNCNLDMDIQYKNICGSLDINQINGNSVLHINKNENIFVKKKGIGNSIYFYEKDQLVETFSDDDSTNAIVLNGLKSELIIKKNNFNIINY